ncbi:signal recognition particle-docking protein FtsY [Rodentibacter pneumotropicus]|nr:signal recognition particle-docking protein FtsY [Rodentibacter pneumotropicus]THA07885.1 signal recognition particle-docking protein FtsY [Rodentibacter pneumotropicus]THA13408.1 signal recognition particle-docking protein FtsY [Rodentibacter pneumotropicus]
MNHIFIGRQLREQFMTEEKKKGGFWASLFGRNKQQEAHQIEPVIIEEEKIEQPTVEETTVEQQIESENIAEQQEDTESAVNSESVFSEDTQKDDGIQTEIEEKTAEISTALESSDPIIVPENAEKNLPIEEVEIEPEIIEDIKEELQPTEETETREKPSEGGFFSRLVKGLLKTKQNIGAGFRSFFLGKKIDDELFEELEEQLLIADIGVPTTSKIIKNLTEHASRKQLQDAELLYQQLKVEMANILEPVAQPLKIDTSKKPYVILMVGVNGVGKTTTIGKLARKFQAEGKSVMLAAGDTFRAAAVEQLQVWGERNNIPVVAQSTGSDSASVIFDAMQSAAARNIDILIADTAGRLQNKNNLMDELKKIVRVMKKYDESAPHEIMLTLDAGTGQNAISQAKLFNEAVGLTGVSLTKLDGTAKGGVIFAIADQFNLPIRYIGVGEKIEDLREFNATEFIDALFVHENEE